MITDRIQEALRRSKLDGWLFFDHHRRDPLAYRILEIPETVVVSRRWYYFIPANAEPQKLVHRIESSALDNLPGKKQTYSSWEDQQEKLGHLLSSSSRVAMQYSPNCSIPYVSLVDAGTVELVRSYGVEVVTAADLIQEFEARWNDAQFNLHIEAGKLVDQARREAFDLIRERLRSKGSISEFEVQQFIRARFKESGLTTDHGPIVAVNANASDPHYEPQQDRTARVQAGDLVLIDMWAKLNRANAVYYDITWTGFCGQTIPERIQSVFTVVKTARQGASNFVIGKIGSKQSIAGWEVDDVARSYIKKEGFGEFFVHRTGHSIGTEVHGNGANIDNFESHDDRVLAPNTCFSIEPGIYLPEFGIRSEVNLYVGDGFATVTGEEQEELMRL